jgi:hypothetical protein
MYGGMPPPISMGYETAGYPAAALGGFNGGNNCGLVNECCGLADKGCCVGKYCTSVKRIRGFRPSRVSERLGPDPDPRLQKFTF